MYDWIEISLKYEKDKGSVKGIIPVGRYTNFLQVPLGLMAIY